MRDTTPRRTRSQAALLRSAVPAAPPGFEIVEAVAGMGKTSIVAKVRRTADGELFAWKLGVSDSEATRRAMREQTERSREWVRLGVSRAPSIWSADQRTLLQPWIEGTTLREAVSSSSMFTDPRDARHAALVEFLRRLAGARTFVSGLNAMNLVYDGASWQIVDSGHVREYATPSEAWARQRSDLARKWTRGPLAGRRRDVDAFLAAADAALGLPPARFSLRRWWRGLRGR